MSSLSALEVVYDDALYMSTFTLLYFTCIIALWLILIPVPLRVGGWVGLGSWLHTEVIYPPEDGHPSQY